MNKIRVGIETRSMTGNMTGIGNYAFHLIRSLIDDPALEYVGFGEFNWSNLDAAALHRIGLKHSKVGNDSAAERSHAANAVSGLSRYLAKSYAARLAYRKARSVHFASTVRRQDLDLFHATNFLPPADPGVQVLPVLYDLSFVRYPSSHPAERRRWLNRMPLLLERSPLVQTISEFSRSEIESVYGYPRERIFVAPPAASQLFRPLGEEITRRGITQFDLIPSSYLLAVGTLEPRKNLTTLISAYANLSSSERDRVPLVVAGGAGWGELGLPKEASALIRNGQLRFVGMVSDAHLQKSLRRRGCASLSVDLRGVRHARRRSDGLRYQRCS